MEKEIKELLNQILANQVVIYDMLRVLSGKTETTPKNWIIEELEEKSKEFKNLL